MLSTFLVKAFCMLIIIVLNSSSDHSNIHTISESVSDACSFSSNYVFCFLMSLVIFCWKPDIMSWLKGTLASWPLVIRWWGVMYALYRNGLTQLPSWSPQGCQEGRGWGDCSSRCSFRWGESADLQARGEHRDLRTKTCFTVDFLLCRLQSLIFTECRVPF